MKLIQRIIRPAVLMGAIFVAGSNINASTPPTAPTICIDSFINQIDSFLCSQSQSLNAEIVNQLRTFKDSLDNGSLSRSALLVFYTKLQKSGNKTLIDHVDSLAKPLMNAKSEQEFWYQIRLRKQKGVKSGTGKGGDLKEKANSREKAKR